MEESFGENFRGGRQTVFCPLCDSHRDGQEEFFNSCQYLQDILDKNGNYEDLFSINIPIELTKTLTRMSKIRKM